jgi:diguanylate cyclase (GGDEF)-like protein
MGRKKIPDSRVQELEAKVKEIESQIAERDQTIAELRGIVEQFTRRVVQLRAALRAAQHSQLVDGLTGLMLKAEFDEHALPGMVRRAKDHGKPLSVVFLDLNDFSHVNNMHGHAAGDAVLREVAHRIRRALRPDDVAGRVGGEEFAIILPGTSKEQAGRVAKRIYTAIARDPYSIPGNGEVRMTASVGYACAAECGYDTEALYAAADNAMYRGKAKKGSKEPTISD